MKKSAKKELSADDICNALRLAAKQYLANRKRDAVYELLKGIYRIYRKIRCSEYMDALVAEIASTAPKRRKTAKLSHLLFYVASADFDRRDVFKWAKFLENAFVDGIKSNDFIASLKQKNARNAASKEKKQPQTPWRSVPINSKAEEIAAADVVSVNSHPTWSERNGSPYYRPRTPTSRPAIASSGTRTSWKHNYR